jgi:lambda repressor-like predicted transcriptional regulator
MHILTAIFKTAIEPAIQDYGNGCSLRALSRKYGLSTKVYKEILEENGSIIRNDMRAVYDDQNQAMISNAVNDYRNGDGLRTITKRYKIGARVFYRHLEEQGIPVRSAQANRYPYLNSKNMDMVKTQFSEGKTMAEIARNCNLSRSSVKTMLRHLGIRRRSKSETSEITKWHKLRTKDIPGKFITNWKASAKTRGHAWEVSPEYLQSLFNKQGGLCFYTGIKLNNVISKSKSLNRVDPNKMSLDRKDSSLGYIPGNVVLCSAFANYAKSDFPLDVFIDLLKTAGTFQLSKTSQAFVAN